MFNIQTYNEISQKIKLLRKKTKIIAVSKNHPKSAVELATDVEVENDLTVNNDLQVDGTLKALGTVELTGLPSHADDAAAGAAGLTAGQLYQTDGTGQAPFHHAGILMIKQ